MIKKQKVDVITLITVIGFTFAVFYHYALVNYLGLTSYPFNTFLFTPNDRFNDFFNIYKTTIGLNPYISPVSVYFPFTFIIVYLFTFLKAAYSFALIIIIFIIFLILYIKKNLDFYNGTDKYLSIFVLTFISYPILFVIDRGNLEIILFIFLALFLYFFQKGEDWKSILWLSFASAMKLYPLAFIVLFAVNKKYKQMVATIALTLFISLLSAAVLDGGIMNSFIGLKKNLLLFNAAYFSSDQGLQHNSSLFGSLRLLQIKLAFIWLFVKYYNYIFILLTVLMGLYVTFIEQTLWKRIALIVFYIILVPQVSFDYKLIHLFLPIVVFIRAESGKLDVLYAIIFGLLIIPKDYYLISADISISVLINPMLMLGMISLFIFENIKFKSKLNTGEI